MKTLNFRQFFELEEKNPNFIDTIQDELGINPDDLKNGGEWASGVSLGNLTYNGIMYTIVKMVKKGNDIVGAMIKPMNLGSQTQRAYIGSGDKQIKSPDNSVSSAEIFLPKEKLNALLTQGMENGAQAGAGGLPQ